eukprot:1848264-Rhodomonas_salina.1
MHGLVGRVGPVTTSVWRSAGAAAPVDDTVHADPQRHRHSEPAQAVRLRPAQAGRPHAARAD